MRGSLIPTYLATVLIASNFTPVWAEAASLSFEEFGSVANVNVKLYIGDVLTPNLADGIVVAAGVNEPHLAGANAAIANLDGGDTENWNGLRLSLLDLENSRLELGLRAGSVVAVEPYYPQGQEGSIRLIYWAGITKLPQLEVPNQQVPFEWASIVTSVKKSLTDAADKGLGSVAITFLGTGGKESLDVDQSAAAILQGIGLFARENPSRAMEVILVAYENSTIFQNRETGTPPAMNLVRKTMRSGMDDLKADREISLPREGREGRYDFGSDMAAFRSSMAKANEMATRLQAATRWIRDHKDSVRDGRPKPRVF